MASNFLVNGTDLDSLFASHVANNASYATNYTVDGSDFQLRYDSLANPANINKDSRIPNCGYTTSATGWSANTDLSSIFCGNSSQYTTNTVLNPSHAGFTSPITLTHIFTITFSSSTALTNYFYYGGRIIISPTQSSGTTADTDLINMFSQVGNFVITGSGNYFSGSGTNVTNNGAYGGSTIGTTSQTILSATEPTLYTSNSYTIKLIANANSGSANILTITIT